MGLTGENKVLSNKIEYIKTKSAQAVDDLKHTEKRLEVSEKVLNDLKSKVSNSNILVVELQEDRKTKESLIEDYKASLQCKEEAYADITQRLKDKEGEAEMLCQ